MLQTVAHQECLANRKAPDILSSQRSRNQQEHSMKIGDKTTLDQLRKNSTPSPASKKTGGGLLSLFSAELTSVQSENVAYDRDINELRSEIDAAGQMLEREPTLPNFKRFRELLGRLTKRVSNEAYRLEKIGGTPMNPRYYEIITVIDKEADKLYQLIINEQKDRMAITASVIGIKGLVVDLVT